MRNGELEKSESTLVKAGVRWVPQRRLETPYVVIPVRSVVVDMGALESMGFEVDTNISAALVSHLVTLAEAAEEENMVRSR